MSKNKNEKINNDEMNNSTEDNLKENSEENIEEKAEEINPEIEKLENEVADLKDKLLRRAAEFENYKRRTENDQLNLLKYAAESLIVKLLPIVDDFERSLQHMENAKDVEAVKKGIQLIYEKLIRTLNEQGVQKIDAVGSEFDVHLHEALLQRKDPDAKPHTILDEIEKGYMYKDKVIRHSKVIVNEDSSENETGNEQNERD